MELNEENVTDPGSGLPVDKMLNGVGRVSCRDPDPETDSMVCEFYEGFGRNSDSIKFEVSELNHEGRGGRGAQSVNLHPGTHNKLADVTFERNQDCSFMHESKMDSPVDHGFNVFCRRI